MIQKLSPRKGEIMIDKTTAKQYQKMFDNARDAIQRGESELPDGISLSELSSFTQVYTLDESKKYSNEIGRAHV